MDNIPSSKLTDKQIEVLTAAHIAVEPQWGPRYLMGSRHGEWLDTDATFAPGVMLVYPEIPAYGAAAGYAVGYGSLVALNPAGRQAAYWDGDNWVED